MIKGHMKLHWRYSCYLRSICQDLNLHTKLMYEHISGKKHKTDVLQKCREAIIGILNIFQLLPKQNSQHFLTAFNRKRCFPTVL